MFDVFTIPGRDLVRTIALVSRFLVFLIQVISNVFPDHNPDAFLPNTNPPGNVLDHTARSTFDGFHKWDSKHFIQIAEYGYKEESQFAFFPLFPLLVRYAATVLSVCSLGLFSFATCCIVSSVAINTLCFVESSVALFDFTNQLFASPKFAGLVSLMFSFNPASIFFSSAYTEAMFSLFVFKGLLSLCRRSFFISTFWFVLASATRSNGTVNAGFIVYYCVLDLVVQLRSNFSPGVMAKHLLRCALLCILILAPFVLFNAYAFTLYCMDDSTIDCKIAPYWCCQAIPSIYDHIQKFYWNVGLFKYYRFRKIPNFIVAAPTVVLCLTGVWKYLKKRGYEIWCLGLPLSRSIKVPNAGHGDLMFRTRNIFCFIVHILFLVAFSLLFMHVEVVTRMVMSSSPVPYWVASSYILRDLQNIDSRAIFPVYSQLSVKSKRIVWYFLGYLVIGTCLHVNFLPWT